MNVPDKLFAVLDAVKSAGGSPHFVGGTVRDDVWNVAPKDFDVEVSGMQFQALHDVLSKFDVVDVVGKQFAILKLHNLGADFSLPRRENKIGVGHKDFEVVSDPNMSLVERCRRRDLTMNSMEMDPWTGLVSDPYNGLADMASHRMRATDPKTFVEDDLRAVRVAQFISRFPHMIPDEELISLCSKADLSHLPGERIGEEFRKLLVKGSRPDLGLDFLQRTGLLKNFPELQATVGCEQHPVFHAEGDVFTHTKMALRVATTLKGDNEEENLLLMVAVLCHDLGKPPTTVWSEEKKRLVSNGHDHAGVQPAEDLLKRMMAPTDLIEGVKVLVKEHLKPFELIKEKAGAAAYRRLARRMKGTSLNLLAKLAIADGEGRICYDEGHQTRDDINTFLLKAQEVGVHNLDAVPEDVVKGRHLLDKGYQPSPEIGKILQECRQLQDETGETDPEKILQVVLNKSYRGS
jgi:tRNA nucleotidyltransferase (CCA-adding enzyme)